MSLSQLAVRALVEPLARWLPDALPELGPA